MKLISMTDFVLEQKIEIQKKAFGMEKFYESMSVTIKYANFLKQPLTLGMFVPCYDDGQIHEKPSDLCYQLANENNHTASKWAIEEYEEAKEKVLFKGFEIEQSDESGEDIVCNYTVHNFPFNFSAWSIYNTKDTIEDMLNDGHNYPFELTESAIKQIGYDLPTL